MTTMARKRPTKRDGTSKPKKSVATGHYALDLGPELMAAVVRWAEANRRSINLAIVMLVEDSLTRVGCWPPPPSEVKKE